MNRFLIFCCLFAAGFAVFFKLESDNRLKRLTNAENQIVTLEKAVNEQKRVIEVYAEAEKQTKEFEKELNNDTTDNLDVVPADYILKQLHTD